MERDDTVLLACVSLESLHCISPSSRWMYIQR